MRHLGEVPDGRDAGLRHGHLEDGHGRRRHAQHARRTGLDVAAQPARLRRCAQDRHRPRVRYGGRDRPEADPLDDADPLGDLDHRGPERLPAVVGLGAGEHEHVVFADRRATDRELRPGRARTGVRRRCRGSAAGRDSRTAGPSRTWRRSARPRRSGRGRSSPRCRHRPSHRRRPTRVGAIRSPGSPGPPGTPIRYRVMARRIRWGLTPTRIDALDCDFATECASKLGCRERHRLAQSPGSSDPVITSRRVPCWTVGARDRPEPPSRSSLPPSHRCRSWGSPRRPTASRCRRRIRRSRWRPLQGELRPDHHVDPPGERRPQAERRADRLDRERPRRRVRRRQRRRHPRQGRHGPSRRQRPGRRDGRRPRRSDVTATGGGATAVLPVTIRVNTSAAGDVSLTTQTPTLTGASDANFSFDLTFNNDTAQDLTLSVSATGEAGWDIKASLAGQTQAASTVVKAGSTPSITSPPRPPPTRRPAPTRSRSRRTAGDRTATADLGDRGHRLVLDDPLDARTTSCRPTAPPAGRRPRRSRSRIPGTAPITAVSVTGDPADRLGRQVRPGYVADHRRRPDRHRHRHDHAVAATPSPATTVTFTAKAAEPGATGTSADPVHGRDLADLGGRRARHHRR